MYSYCSTIRVSYYDYSANEKQESAAAITSSFAPTIAVFVDNLLYFTIEGKLWSPEFFDVLILKELIAVAMRRSKQIIRTATFGTPGIYL
jgi:hypothetical protein